MKMLTRDSNVPNLQSLKERLEANGIPSVIQGTETARMIIPRFFLEPTLWVYLDSQLDDALKLIDDPGHNVTTGIDIDDFYAEQPSEDELRSAVTHTIVNLFAIVLMVALIVFIIMKVL
ncbi:MAG: DUF2007 domain-containing protein [Candidatus Thiodiazotropha sp. (ex Ctena orbiculata)]|uniref:DUF2007 domain-containing protein n=1 Tax=Candidatus Thiodiazotropha taylori TaxID=2792791 RepID=A0A944QUN8_9GAMM|nr:DUF2007 domain-containing protein [Candidatus Thiodiazotropha taylori]PVV17780.1 MAG: hypothetical protein B6D74_17515 [gamma proteobacterium symbiont of Ctena orbiculata]MBT2989090.1 DUF2007 domain-containing protein [Candidatus Thiodiazotropha taylori]MBT2996264.1 DUF2007 domain-containing protein [Candidatus Thiodiazotropha taylori]MBT3000302.1 DUF2007 domain-containing protein [Candidatus Thiodiazotropha taylori]